MQKIIECDLKDILSESDVEQKFVLPLLTSEAPLGLEYSFSDFKTKNDIRKLKIDKGGSAKYYFPDYAIVHTGLPLLIIEAKKPGEDLMEAYREARLYATEINAQFPTKINPCQKIIVTNAETTIAGNWDSEENLITVKFEDVNAVAANFYEFINFVGSKGIFKSGDEILTKLRGTTRYSRALSLMGGKTVQNEELRPNGFGATLSLEFKYLFNPESYDERKNVVTNAYVKSRRVLKQVDPIEKVIRATIPIGSRELTQIEDTSQPAEILAKLADKKNLKNQLLLLVGTVGSGKSTFTDYLKEVALTPETRSETIWLSMNLNLAPLNRDEIYKWLKKQIVEKLKELHSDIDFEEASSLMNVYAPEFQALKKGAASFYEKDSSDYRKLFAEKLIELEQNLDIQANAFVRYLCAERNNLLVIVLDNCDKRKLEDQLLMFDVANWLKVTFNCLVFLPLRDSTFDNFRKEPPLDTVIKDFVFRIDPPLLREVISARLKYALREMTVNKTKFSFVLPNGMSVEYPHTDQGYYLASIVRSLFDSTYFSRLITGLAGRDIRKGLEIFLDFCKSGHINEAEIFKIRQSKGEHILQNHLISRVILRGNRRFYSDANSLVRNLFHSHPEDLQPNPFARLSILRWLKQDFKKEGPSRAIGYHKVALLFNELIPYGHSLSRLKAELSILIRSRCVVTESQSEEHFDEEDLIAIAPSGIIHLELVTDINYIASCAEDVWYRELKPATEIQQRITSRIGGGHYSRETTIINSDILITYLIGFRQNTLLSKPETYLEEDKIIDYIQLDPIKEIIDRSTKNVTEEAYPFLKQYPVGSEHEGEVVSTKTYGIFVEFGLNGIGMVHISTMNGLDPGEFDHGERVKVLVEGYKTEYHKFDLRLIGRL